MDIITLRRLKLFTLINTEKGIAENVCILDYVYKFAEKDLKKQIIAQFDEKEKNNNNDAVFLK